MTVKIYLVQPKCLKSPVNVYSKIQEKPYSKHEILDQISMIINTVKLEIRGDKRYKPVAKKHESAYAKYLENVAEYNINSQHAENYRKFLHWLWSGDYTFEVLDETIACENCTKQNRPPVVATRFFRYLQYKKITFAYCRECVNEDYSVMGYVRGSSEISKDEYLLSA